VQHLVGQKLPDVDLQSSGGSFVNPAKVAGRAVYFVYPYTGKAGHPDPENWDHIAGAHGSTPQAIAYAKAMDEFVALNANVFGVSLLSPEWQADFSKLHNLPYSLLSDLEGTFSKQLALPRFVTGGREYLSRISLIVNDGIITNVRFPVSPPQDDAKACLDILRSQT
jgi:peroxiredoxin